MAAAFDNGRIRVSLLDQIPLAEIYHEGELALADVQWINQVIFHQLPLPPHRPVPVIIDKAGSYSLSADAMVNLQELMNEFCCVAYVSYSHFQEKMVEFARDSYLSGKPVANFPTRGEALAWVKKQLASPQP